MTVREIARPERVDLPLSGMTCAACARSIERTLANTPGVERAHVNFATATATVEFRPGQAKVGDLIGAIEDLGYGVPETEPAPDTQGLEYRRRLIVSLLLAVPVMALGMMHRAVWLQLALTLPVVFYCGAPFYVSAWSALRHRSANMNTLIALGTGTAFLYSVYETLRGGHQVYYEASAAIIALVLLGRTLEAMLAIEALQMALTTRKPAPGLVHHSDRGVQYASGDYSDLLKANGIQISMSRCGNPYDNAQCESFMKTLKYEEVYRNEYRDLAEARTQIGAFLEKVYNRKRLHSALGYLPPARFEAQLTERNMEAAAPQFVA